MPPRVLLTTGIKVDGSRLRWRPLAAGRSQRSNEKVRSADVTGEQRVEVIDLEFRGRAEDSETGVVDQDINVAHLASQPRRPTRIAQVRTYEPAASARALDDIDHLGAAARIAAVDNRVEAVQREPQRGSLAHPRGRPGHQGGTRLQAGVIRLHRHACSSWRSYWSSTSRAPCARGAPSPEQVMPGPARSASAIAPGLTCSDYGRRRLAAMRCSTVLLTSCPTRRIIERPVG
jgi:hypothetical protein